MCWVPLTGLLKCLFSYAVTNCKEWLNLDCLIAVLKTLQRLFIGQHGCRQIHELRKLHNSATQNNPQQAGPTHSCNI